MEEPAVTLASIEAGEFTPSQTDCVVVPPTVTVFVVICTRGTVTVVTNVVVMLLPGHVRPEDIPVVKVAGMIMLEEYVMVVHGAGLPGASGVVVTAPALGS